MEEITVSNNDSQVKPRRVISAGFLLESSGKYLLGCPSHRTGTTGGWGIPKGKRDKGEDIFQTAVREFYEETAFKIIDPACGGIDYEFNPFFSYNTEGKDKTGKFKKTVYVFRAYDVSRRLHQNVTPFKCLTFVDGGHPEIAQYKWATPEEAIELVVKSQKPIFEFITNYNKHLNYK